MNVVKRVTLLFLAVFALASIPIGAASAEVVKFEEGGKPTLTGKIEGENAHGVIHCPSIAKIFGDSARGAAAGVIVVKPNGEWQLSAPPGGECEALFLALTGG